MLLEEEHKVFMLKDGVKHGSGLIFDPSDNILLYYEYYCEGKLVKRADIYSTLSVDLSTVLIDDEFDTVLKSNIGTHYNHYKQGCLHDPQYTFSHDNIHIDEYDMGRTTGLVYRTDETREILEQDGKRLVRAQYWPGTRIVKYKHDYVTDEKWSYHRMGWLFYYSCPRGNKRIVKKYNGKGELRYKGVRKGHVDHGPYTEYSGKHKTVGEYVHGRKHGRVERWRKGKLLWFEIYSYGEIQYREEISPYMTVKTNYRNGLKHGIEIIVRHGIETTRQWHRGKRV